MSRPELFGKDLDIFLTTASHHVGNVTFLGHDIPVKENRVTLSNRKDRNGMRPAHVVHNLSDNSKALKAAGIKLGHEVLNAAGSTTVWSNPNVNQQIMGGVIMGSDRKTAARIVTASLMMSAI
jgi:hypothetical protein